MRRGLIITVVATVLAASGVLGMVSSAVQASAAAAAWTQQHPPTSPPRLVGASMAYDAATGTVVLFGGVNSTFFFDSTWTWG